MGMCSQRTPVPWRRLAAPHAEGINGRILSKPRHCFSLRIARSRLLRAAGS